jgi:hypothetical protein
VDFNPAFWLFNHHFNQWVITMKYDVSERYNCVIITLKGNVMGGPDAEQFRDTLHKLIEEGKKRSNRRSWQSEIYEFFGTGNPYWGVDNHEKCRGRISDLPGRQENRKLADGNAAYFCI